MKFYLYISCFVVIEVRDDVIVYKVFYVVFDVYFVIYFDESFVFDNGCVFKYYW